MDNGYATIHPYLCNIETELNHITLNIFWDNIGNKMQQKTDKKLVYYIYLAKKMQQKASHKLETYITFKILIKFQDNKFTRNYSRPAQSYSKKTLLFQNQCLASFILLQFFPPPADCCVAITTDSA